MQARVCHCRGADRMASGSLFQLYLWMSRGHTSVFISVALVSFGSHGWHPPCHRGALDLGFPWMVPLPGRNSAGTGRIFILEWWTTQCSWTQGTVFFCPAAERSYMISWLFFFLPREPPQALTYMYATRASWLAAELSFRGVAGFWV